MYYNIFYQVICDMKGWFSRCTTGIFYKKFGDNKDNGQDENGQDENGQDYIRLYDEIWDL